MARVRAIEQGFDGLCVRNPGEEFEFNGAPAPWFEFVDEKDKEAAREAALAARDGAIRAAVEAKFREELEAKVRAEYEGQIREELEAKIRAEYAERAKANAGQTEKAPDAGKPAGSEQAKAAEQSLV